VTGTEKGTDTGESQAEAHDGVLHPGAQAQPVEGSAEGGPRARALSALRRAAVYRVMALGFSEPGEDLVRALCSGDLVSELVDALATLGASDSACGPALQRLRRAASEMEAAGAAAPLRELSVEYARLFTGPGRPDVAGYESEYTEARPDGGRGRLHGAATAAVAAVYREEGVAVAAALREPPDSVAAELEFLYLLSRREEQAWQADDEGEALRLRRTAGRFLAEHASRWLPKLAADVRATSGSHFYAGLAEVLETFLGHETTASPGSAADDERRGAGAG